MNTPNNKRRKASQSKMEAAFIELLQNRELKEIRVTDVCKLAGVNRTTFYANYSDIYQLKDVVQMRLEGEVAALYQDQQGKDSPDYDFSRLFRHIQENQLFYKTYFKLGLDGTFQIPQHIQRSGARYGSSRHLAYHIEFFRNGLNAVIKRWLEQGCPESPEELSSIIEAEYTGRC